MKCKRRKALFGLDDAAIIGLIGSIIGAGSNIYKANQNKKAIQQQQRAENMAAIDQQNLALQQNLGALANNRDYITNREQDIILNTRNENQLKYGGENEKYAVRDNTRTRFVPGKGYVPNAKLNKNTGKDVKYDDGPLGFIPVVGDVLQGGQAFSDLKEKKYKRAALNAGLLFLPNAIEKLGKPVVKTVAKSIKGNKKGQYLDEIAERIEELNKQQKAVEYLTNIDPLPFEYGGQYKDRFSKQMFRLKRR